MKYAVSVLAVLAAPVLYGFLCVPTINLLMSSNADLLNDMGGTYDVGLTLQAEAVQLIVLLIIGFAVAAIARFKPMLHVGIAVAVMLAIGVSVQLSFWDAMLIWHHFVFFGLIAVCLPLGGMIAGKVLKPKALDLNLDEGA